MGFKYCNVIFKFSLAITFVCLFFTVILEQHVFKLICSSMSSALIITVMNYCKYYELWQLLRWKILSLHLIQFFFFCISFPEGISASLICIFMLVMAGNFFSFGLSLYWKLTVYWIVLLMLDFKSYVFS